MKFKANIEDLTAALDVASIVHPSPVDAEGSAGYLLVVRGAECFVYSADDHQSCRASFPIFDVEGEGAFVLPSKGIGAYKNLSGWIEFEPAMEGGAHVYREESQGHFGGGTFGTFDPRSLQILDKDFDKAKEGPSFSVMLLKEAISSAKPYLADANAAEEHLKTMQVFDDSDPNWAKGNGHLFSSDRKRACYFYSPEFVGKGLVIHGARVGLLNAFLAKSEGSVSLRKSESTTYLINSNGHVIGWSDQVATHSRFSYMPFGNDKFVLQIPKSVFIKSLTYVRDKLGGSQDKVRLTYDHEKQSLIVAGSSGADKPTSTVGVRPLAEGESSRKGGALSTSESFAFNANVASLLDLVSPLKGHDVEFRIAPTDSPETFILRTIEEFTLDAKGKVVVPEAEGEEEVFPCRVTRFMSTMKNS